MSKSEPNIDPTTDPKRGVKRDKNGQKRTKKDKKCTKVTNRSKKKPTIAIDR